MDDLRAKLQWRKDCEHKALEIVERLLDNPVDEGFLIDACKFIDQNHYSDVVQERAIAKQCGYPLCSSTLRNIPKQKYHISSQSNKVYDISERKYFCSNRCYSSSKALQKQISSTLVWERKEEKWPPITLSSIKEMKVKAGEAVIIDPATELKKQLEELSLLDQLSQSVSSENKTENFKQDYTILHTQADDQSTSPCSKNEEKTLSSSVDNDQQKQRVINPGNLIVTEKNYDNLEKCNPLLTTSQLPASDTHLDSDDDDDCELLQTETSKGSNATGVVQGHNDKDVEILQQTILQKKAVLSQLQENRAHDLKCQPSSFGSNAGSITLSNLHQTKATNRSFFLTQSSFNKFEKRIDSKDDCNGVDKEHTLQPSDFKTTCSLGIKTNESFSVNDTPVERVTKKILEWLTPSTVQFLNESQTEQITPRDSPSHRTSMDQTTQEFEIKVREFFKGSYTYNKPEQQPDNQRSMPIVESQHQMALRRKIVSDKLSRVLPNLLDSLSLSVHKVMASVRGLLETFRFSSHNIMLRPAEWNLLGFIILKLLCVREKELADAFQKSSVRHHYRTLLLTIKTKESEIQDFVDLITKKIALCDTEETQEFIKN